MSMLRRLARDTSGATAIEYGLIVGILCGVLIATLTILGDQLSTTFIVISDAISPSD